MNAKKLLNFLMIFAVAFLAMNLFTHFFFKPKGKPHPHRSGGAQATGTGAGYQKVVPVNQVAPTRITLGSAVKGQPYLLAVTVSNVSAGIENVKLNAAQYRQHIGSDAPLLLLTARPNSPLPFATTKAIINGIAYPLQHVVWGVLSPKTSQPRLSTTLSLTVADAAGHPLARIDKTFRINPKTYDVRITQKIYNLTSQPMRAALDELGPTDLPLQDRQEDLRTFMSAGYRQQSHYLDTSGFPEVYQTAMAESGAQPVKLGLFTGPNRLLWIATSNRFFTAIVRPLPYGPIHWDPLDNGQQIPRITFLHSAWVKRIGSEPSSAEPRGIAAVVLKGASLQIPAGGHTAMPLSVYCGPKKRSILAGSAHAQPGSPSYQYNLFHYLAVIQFNQGSWCSFLTFAWLALAILKILTWIHTLIPNYGIAIMIFVLLIRLLLHPLTRYGQITMTKTQRKMAALAPDLERLRTKYAKDKPRLQQETMALYKERNVNPASSVLGCLPMLLQMPIWIALYSGLAVDIDLRQAGFIPGWITNLSNPDTIYSHPISFHIPILGYQFAGQNFIAFNLLPLLLGVVFFLQMKMQMKLSPPPTDPQQRQTQMISQYMILLFPLFLYNAPSGLNLYICASTIGGLVDSWLVRRHLRKMDAAAALATTK